MTQFGPLRIAIVLFTLLTTSLLAEQGAPPSTTPPPTGARGRGGRGGPPRVVPVPDAPRLPHVAVETPLPLPPGMTWGVVASVALDSQGHVFVYHRMPTPLLEFDGNGTFLRGLREGTATRAHSVRIDADDNIWLVDAGDHTVTKLNSDGEVVMTLGTSGVVGMGDADAAAGRFNIPSDVGIAPNGDVFIAQGEAAGPDPRIIRFDRTGRFLNTWSLAYPEGTRSDPHAIAIGRNGLVYVADRNVMRVRVFSADGLPVRDIQLQNLVCGIFIDADDQLWVSTGMDGQVLKVDQNGTVLGFTGRRGTAPGEMSEAHMIAVSSDGDIYVADTVGQKIVKFAAP